MDNFIKDNVINTLYITDSNNNVRLILDSTKNIDVNIHIQLSGLNNSKHELKFLVLKNDINSSEIEELTKFKTNLNLIQDDAKIFENGAFYVADLSYNFKAESYEVINASAIKFEATLDNKYKKDLLIFLKGDNNGGH